MPGGGACGRGGQARSRLRSPSCSGRSSPERPRSARPCAGQRGPGSTCPGRRLCSVTTRLGSLSRPRRGRGPGVTEATDPAMGISRAGWYLSLLQAAAGFCLGPPVPQPPSPGALSRGSARGSPRPQASPRLRGPAGWKSPQRGTRDGWGDPCRKVCCFSDRRGSAVPQEGCGESPKPSLRHGDGWALDLPQYPRDRS